MSCIDARTLKRRELVDRRVHVLNLASPPARMLAEADLPSPATRPVPPGNLDTAEHFSPA